jgi:hypothetical protein
MLWIRIQSFAACGGEMPDLLQREGLRSLKMTPEEFFHQTRETPLPLFVVNCCMDTTFDSKRYYDATGRTLYLTNTALTAGVEITDKIIAAYRAAREGDKNPFASANRSPRQQVQDSDFATSGFCCVSVKDNNNLVGNCIKCIKKMAWNCPSVLKVRKLTEGFPDNEDPRTLMSVYGAGRTKENGDSGSEFLSGKKCAKSKATKRAALLLHDPHTWLAQRNNPLRNLFGTDDSAPT